MRVSSSDFESDSGEDVKPKLKPKNQEKSKVKETAQPVEEKLIVVEEESKNCGTPEETDAEVAQTVADDIQDTAIQQDLEPPRICLPRVTEELEERENLSDRNTSIDIRVDVSDIDEDTDK